MQYLRYIDRRSQEGSAEVPDKSVDMWTTSRRFREDLAHFVEAKAQHKGQTILEVPQGDAGLAFRMFFRAWFLFIRGRNRFRDQRAPRGRLA